jgi:hypothetical protein
MEKKKTERGLEIEYFNAKNLIDKKILSREGNDYVLDMEALMETSPESYDFFLI